MPPTLPSLLQRGYFPKELPPIFTTKLFANYIAANPPLLPARLTSRSAVHNLARPGGQRRRLHIPNPFAQYITADLVVRNWGDVETHLANSNLSVSKPVEDPTGNRALRVASDGSDLASHRAHLRASARYVLRTDISRYYGSIYTHSIPWALKGKAWSKMNRRGGFANDLDEALRNGQDGQTLGLPVGPDTSLVVAEILACAVDQDLERSGLEGMRFMDDYEFGFTSRSDAEAGLATVEEALMGYELAVNPRKTWIDELPISLDRSWTTELKGFAFLGLTAADSTLIRYFNRAFELKVANPTESVLSYAIARLRALKAARWQLLENLLLQCASTEPGCLESVITQFEKNRGHGISGRLERVIDIIVDQHAPLAHGSELVWALWAAIWFNRRIEDSSASKLDGNPDSFVALLTLYSQRRGLISRDVTFPRWSQLMRKDSLDDTAWLLAYEADIQGWLPSQDASNHVDSHPRFAPLKQAGVSFMDLGVRGPTRTLISALTDGEPAVY